MTILQLDNRRGFPNLLSFKQIDIFSVNARLIHDQEIKIGDKVKRTFINAEYENCYFDGEIEAIVECRPAAGAWHPTIRPDYYEVILNGTISRTDKHNNPIPTKLKKK